MPFAAPFGDSLAARAIGLFLGSNLLIVAVGAYDLATRRRLHPAYVTGVAGVLALEVAALVLPSVPAWQALAMKMIGH
jgi:hypothetical protein